MIDKNTNTGHFKLLPVIYLHCDMQVLVEKNSALLCFLDGFGILFQYLVITNIQLGHQLYNNCTRL